MLPNPSEDPLLAYTHNLPVGSSAHWIVISQPACVSAWISYDQQTIRLGIVVESSY